MVPTVTILMAIYKPNIKWLIEQLYSLNEQTYSNLKLLVWNDCPEDEIDYKKIYNKCITKFEYSIINSDKNLGSNGAFSKLTEIANSDYIAYCDQDDIWLSRKIEYLVKFAQSKETVLVCSDMFVIDENDKIVSNSITKIRKHQKFYLGKEQFKHLLSHNFVTGCTILVKTDFAKKVIPFPKEYFHDWWLALHAAYINSLYVIKEPLIKYRIHSNNQTGFLLNIIDKQSYLENHLFILDNRVKILKNTFYDKKSKYIIDEFANFIKYRIDYQKKFSLKALVKIYKMRDYDLIGVYFEIIISILPKIGSNLLIKIIKNFKL